MSEWLPARLVVVFRNFLSRILSNQRSAMAAAVPADPPRDLLHSTLDNAFPIERLVTALGITVFKARCLHCIQRDSRPLWCYEVSGS